MQNKISSLSIGKTPFLKLSENLYAKLESLNPSGSIKDRMAAYILDRAEERGELTPGATIIEATSGNTGIALAMLAAERGYKMIVVMPSDMSEERKQMIQMFGGTIEEVGPSDFTGAVARADELALEHSAYRPNQFENTDNISAHREGTGAEIINAMEKLPEQKTISAFVTGVGTGGTLMGVREALVVKYPQIETVVVEAVESAVIAGGEPGEHDIQGISDGFIPGIVDVEKIDHCITVSSQEAIARMRKLTQENGLLVGISSGANVLAAERYIEKHKPDGIVVTLLPDRQERYFSMLT